MGEWVTVEIDDRTFEIRPLTYGECDALDRGELPERPLVREVTDDE